MTHENLGSTQLKTSFVIVIPSRRRLQTLRAALQTCLDQEYDDFKIVILVNSCPETVAWLDNINDERLQVMASEVDLAMTDNWERFFDLPINPETYVFFLGDDDGLLPGALKSADFLIQRLRTPVLTWEKAEYGWPDVLVSEYQNIASLRLGRGVEIKQTHSFLKAAHSLRATYSDGPSIYSSFVQVRVLQQIREAAGGRFFWSCSPDVFSSYAIASWVDSFVQCRFPLSVNGASGHSTGIAYMYNHTGEATAHLIEVISIHHAITHAPSIHIADADGLLVARDVLPSSFSSYQFDFQRLVGLLANQARVESIPARRMVLAGAAVNIASKNGCSIPQIENLTSDSATANVVRQRLGFDPANHRLTIDLSCIGVANVREACVAIAMMNPLEEISGQIRRPASFAKRLARRALRLPRSIYLQLKAAIGN